jgi:hypothetical protein
MTVQAKEILAAQERLMLRWLLVASRVARRRHETPIKGDVCSLNLPKRRELDARS